MVQKSKVLRESGAAPYSDALCAVVSLASTSLRGQTELHPIASASAAGPCCLQLLPPDCILFSNINLEFQQ